jgi:hypothetical protein
LLPLTAAAGFVVCASDILLAPMFLEARTLHRVIMLPKKLSARSTALVLEWNLDINKSFRSRPKLRSS